MLPVVGIHLVGWPLSYLLSLLCWLLRASTLCVSLARLHFVFCYLGIVVDMTKFRHYAWAFGMHLSRYFSSQLVIPLHWCCPVFRFYRSVVRVLLIAALGSPCFVSHLPQVLPTTVMCNSWFVVLLVAGHC